MYIYIYTLFWNIQHTVHSPVFRAHFGFRCSSCQDLLEQEPTLVFSQARPFWEAESSGSARVDTEGVKMWEGYFGNVCGK